MALLLLFALIAGAGTAVTPCVLPVLPALLSASGTGGRRRPIGIVVGLATTFTIAIVALAQLVKGVGLASGAARTLAIVVLITFGLAMLVPELARRIQAPLSRLARFGPRTRGDGFWSGLAVGGALGFVCAPCAGPILAAVTSVSAASGPTTRVIAVAIAYSVGLSAMMLLYAFGGRIALTRIRRVARGEVVERTIGVVLLATGLAMAFSLDVSFEDVLAQHAPAFLIDPTKSLETSAAVAHRLDSLRPESRFVARARRAAAETELNAPGVAIAGVVTPRLPDLGRAPDFTRTEEWFNTPGHRPLTIAGLRGHVVIVDFWTYTCINCIRTLPYLEGLYRHYHRFGLDIVGVETPEFTFEQNPANVASAISADGITYPVVQDNRYGTWDAYQNAYWPAEYYIDATGEVRHTKFGEGNYEQDEAAVRQLLYDAGHHDLPSPMTARAETPSSHLESTETYLDPVRAQADDEDFTEPIDPGNAAYDSASSLAINQWSLSGNFTATSQFITPSAGQPPLRARIDGGVQARDVYLVMTSAGGVPRRGRVLINGKPIPASDRGADVNRNGYFTVTGQRLYRLVRLGTDQQFLLTVELTPGIDAYDFTFG